MIYRPYYLLIIPVIQVVQGLHRMVWQRQQCYDSPVSTITCLVNPTPPMWLPSTNFRVLPWCHKILVTIYHKLTKIIQFYAVYILVPNIEVNVLSRWGDFQSICNIKNLNMLSQPIWRESWLHRTSFCCIFMTIMERHHLAYKAFNSTWFEAKVARFGQVSTIWRSSRKHLDAGLHIWKVWETGIQMYFKSTRVRNSE